MITGSAAGTIEATEDIYLEGAPNLYIQDYNAPLWYNPDSDGFYWNLTGTSTYNVYELGCPTEVAFTENLTMNDVLCDNVGVKDTIQARNYFEFTLTIQSLFPLQTLRIMLKGGVVTETAPTQKMPLGKINNNQYWHLYAPKVYDEDVGDYVWLHLHKCKFIDAFTLNMPFGSPWNLTGIKLRAFVDTTKPAAQYFGMFGRLDPSVIV